MASCRRRTGLLAVWAAVTLALVPAACARARESNAGLGNAAAEWNDRTENGDTVTEWKPAAVLNRVPGTENTGQQASGGKSAAETDSAESEWELDVEDYLDLEKIQESFRALSGETGFSVADTVRGLIRGEIPFEPRRLLQGVADLFLAELREQRQMAVQILIIVLASAVFSNFVRIFENSQIADISFYMMYLLISTLLMRSFLSMNRIVSDTCGLIGRFMRVLLPSYLVTVTLSAGSVSALGFYEITVLGMNLLQALIVRAVLPVINFYLILLILNQMAGEDSFSRLAGLIETAVGWTLKTVFGVVLGLQAVQCLVAPAVDSLKNSALHRLAKTIPGVGGLLDSAAETVTGSAVVIKNAVGVAGIFALLVLCATPLLKLLACILIFRVLCALIQPVSERRMVEGIESISRGALLLLRILAVSLSIFVISLAMITASAGGG